MDGLDGVQSRGTHEVTELGKGRRLLDSNPKGTVRPPAS
jgi:hypothetical protein